MSKNIPYYQHVDVVLNYVLLFVTCIFLLHVNDTILMASCLASSELGVICDGLLQNWIILHQYDVVYYCITFLE